LATNIYPWKENLACVSAYKILVNMQQISSTKTKFDVAADMKLGQLAYFPSTTTSPSLIEMAAMLITREYSKLLSRDYVIAPQTSGVTWKKLMRAMEEVFADKTKTIRDLAEVVDAQIKFGDE
jgi:hypothetical protein